VCSDLNKSVIGHASFVARTGYGAHSRDFFTELNKHIPVRIRNYAHEKNFSHLTYEHCDMVIEQKWNEPPWKCGTPYSGNPMGGDDIINIILMESDHYYFYHDYIGPKIAYNVWESTRQPDHFFNKLLEFDQLWVPTQWQRQCTIDQGYPADKIKVVPEGVDSSIYFPETTKNPILEEYQDDRFKFVIFGRWDYRKSTTEIIQAFLDEFNEDEPVDIVVSIDNPFVDDNLKTTEERLEYHGFDDTRIHVKHYPSRNDYVEYLKSGHVYLSCARSEGWHLPLIEAIACGTPTISSNYGAQLDFCKDVSHLVDIKEMRPAANIFMHDNPVGEFAEPDFDHLRKVMRNVYENYDTCKKHAMEMATVIAKQFSWENAASTAMKHLTDFDKQYQYSTTYEQSPNNDVFIVDAWADTPEKIELLRNKINILNEYNIPICLVSHRIDIPNDILNIVDYFVYDSNNILSDDWNINVWYAKPKDVKVITHFDNKYHGAACYSSLYNAIKVLSGKYENAHFIEYDVELDDLNEYIAKASESLINKKMFTAPYKHGGIYTSLFSFNIKWLDDILEPITTWSEYTTISKDIATKVGSNNDYLFEKWLYNYIVSKDGLDNINQSERLFHIHNIVDQSSYEPCVKSCIAETTEGNIILFVINTRSDEIEDCTISYNGKLVDEILLKQNDVYYKIFDKSGVLCVKDNKTEVIFELDPDKTYTNTRFKFYDNNVKCINWNDEDSIGFLDNVKLENIKYTFIDGAKTEITGDKVKNIKYSVDFIDHDSDINVHHGTIPINNWIAPSRAYYTKWEIHIKRNDELIDKMVLNLEGKNVKIHLDSKAIGDTTAWIPYVDEFRKKHNCNVYVSSFWNKLYESVYPDLRFVNVGTPAPDEYAYYTIGCRDDDYDQNKNNWRLIPLQQVASDYLGLDYSEIKPRIVKSNRNSPLNTPYITISQFSTLGSKQWNHPTGWQDVINYLNDNGVKTMVISKEATHLKNIIDRTNSTINQTINNIQHSNLFIGVSSGPTWLAWALDVPTILISGYSTEWAEMKSCHRIINKDVCNGCFNDLSFKFDRGDWNWCPRHKVGQVKRFECTKSILPSTIINKCNEILSL